ncbi:MAG: hypothetical protein PHX43_01880 [Alphaproteobacteria bacterium]|nr:hypothetical protein [Alphaproteobacteria bacterium]
MPDKKDRIARVIHISDSSKKVTIIIGDQEHEISWHGAPLSLGDVFSATQNNPPQLIEKIGAAIPGAWNTDGDGMRWRRRNAAGHTRMEVLWKRHAIRRAIRDYMDNEGFIEIDTPLLVHGTTPDATIQSFEVGDRYLITSSEYQIKRLEVAGFDRAYTLTNNYRRDDGEGPYRNQEFTMLEWARVGQSLAVIETDAERMTLAAHKALGGNGKLFYQGRSIDLTPPWERMTVADAIERYAGVKLPDFSLASIKQAVKTAKIHVQDKDQNDIYFLFSLLMNHIQPSLGTERPVFICDWPAFETSSTQEKDNGEVAERSELFISGIEISDGFPSLTNYERQKQTFQEQIKRRQADSSPLVSIDEAYLEAMRMGLPCGAGMALGFDRLVMVLTDQPDIRSVLAFAWDEV